MDPAKVLRALPDSTLMSKLGPFLMRAIPNHHSKRRETSIVKNLSKAEVMNVKLELMEVTRRSVSMPVDAVCGVCNKMMGNTVFAAYPNGQVVHYKCLRDTKLCPVTGTVFEM